MWLIPSDTSTCVPESAASASGSSSRSEIPSGLWATSSGKPSARPSSWRGWANRPWIAHVCGARRSKSWTEASCEDRSTSSPPGSRASHSAARASDEGWPTSAPSGQRSGISSPQWSQLASSWRTSTPSLFERHGGTFETWVSSCRRPCASKAKTLAPPSGVRGGSRWSSPTAGDSKQSGSAAYADKNPKAGTTLTDAVRRWPAPTACLRSSNRGGGDSADPRGWSRNGPERPPLVGMGAKWAAPTSRDAKGAWSTGHGSDLGRQLAQAGSGPSGQRSSELSGSTTSRRVALNPEFDEVLIGFPRGWTDGRTGSERSATASVRRWWQQHGRD